MCICLKAATTGATLVLELTHKPMQPRGLLITSLHWIVQRLWSCRLSGKANMQPSLQNGSMVCHFVAADIWLDKLANHSTLLK